jgi:hypothetical protein
VRLFLKKDGYDCEVHLLYRCLGPVVQSVPSAAEGRKGHAVEGRRLPVVAREARGEADAVVPQVSAQGVRGPVREVLVRRVLYEIGLAKPSGWVEPNAQVNWETVEILLKGGRNTAGESSVQLDRDKLVEIYSELPFLGMFGTFWLPGLLCVSMVQPVVDGMNSTWLGADHPFAGASVPLAAVAAGAKNPYRGVYGRLTGVKGSPAEAAAGDVIASCRESGAEELADRLEQDVAGTSPDAQKYQLAATREYLSQLAEEQQLEVLRILAARLNVDASERNVREYREEALKRFAGLKRLQNIYEVTGYIPAGTPLMVRMSLLRPPVDEEAALARIKACFDAAVEVAANLRVIGGMAARGFGLVALEKAVRVAGSNGRTEYREDFREASQAEQFWQWVRGSREAIRGRLAALQAELDGARGRRAARAAGSV